MPSPLLVRYNMIKMPMKVDVRIASKKKLKWIHGIGDKKAKRIINARGPYGSNLTLLGLINLTGIPKHMWLSMIERGEVVLNLPDVLEMEVPQPTDSAQPSVLQKSTQTPTNLGRSRREEERTQVHCDSLQSQLKTSLESLEHVTGVVSEDNPTMVPSGPDE